MKKNNATTGVCLICKKRLGPRRNIGNNSPGIPFLQLKILCQFRGDILYGKSPGNLLSTWLLRLFLSDAAYGDCKCLLHSIPDHIDPYLAPGCCIGKKEG